MNKALDFLAQAIIFTFISILVIGMSWFIFDSHGLMLIPIIVLGALMWAVIRLEKMK